MTSETKSVASVEQIDVAQTDLLDVLVEQLAYETFARESAPRVFVLRGEGPNKMAEAVPRSEMGAEDLIIPITEFIDRESCTIADRVEYHDFSADVNEV